MLISFNYMGKLVFYYEFNIYCRFMWFWYLKDCSGLYLYIIFIYFIAILYLLVLITHTHPKHTHANTQPRRLDQLLNIIGFISKFGSVVLSHSVPWQFYSHLFITLSITDVVSILLVLLYNSGQLFKSFLSPQGYFRATEMIPFPEAA